MQTIAINFPKLSETIILVSGAITTVALFYLRFQVLETGDINNFTYYLAALTPHALVIGLLRKRVD